MTSRKLTDADKTEILNLYRQPGETTLTLANRYNVSNSTISRILKSSLSEPEYGSLVEQKKRSSRSHGSAVESQASAVESPVQTRRVTSSRLDEDSDFSLPPANRRIRKRSSLVSEPESNNFEPPLKTPVIKPQLPPIEVRTKKVVESLDPFDDVYDPLPGAYEEMLGEDLLDREDEDLGDLDEDLDDEDLDDDSFDDLPLWPRKLRPGVAVQVLPLSEAAIPKICYLVIDRSAELIVRPLKEFSDLGQIPHQEVMEKTLPIFDNHRVARRFSTRAQRIIKIPDGRMLQKAGPYLQAKGITRLLIDGQVYSF